MRKTIAAFAAGALISVAAPAVAAGTGGFDDDPTTIDRVGSNDPINSAVAISQARFGSDEASHVVLSRLDNFADSLAGAPLTNDGPMLFTPSDRLADGTRTEIARALADGGKVYLLGGTAAISASVEQQLEADGYATVRLSGASRVETSVAVAREVRRRNPTGTRVILARAYGAPGNETAAWADSVTGGAWAADTATPIVVTGSDQYHPAVKAWVSTDSPNQTIILGGTSAIDDEVKNQTPNPVRIAGSARDGTAVAVAQQLWKSSKARLMVINGYIPAGWTFGLSAAGLAADADAPVLIVNSGSVPDATRSYTTTACGGAKRIDLAVVGGTNVVTNGVASAVEAGDAPPCPPRTFGNGTYRVPEELPAGTYRTTGPSPDLCYWERLDGFSGQLDDINANEITAHVTIVTVRPSDNGFRSTDCATWSTDLSARSTPTATKSAGDYQVNKEMAPGVWRNSDSSDGCYWARLSGWTGEMSDLIANGFSEDVQTVEIAASDVGFSSQDCGTWTKIG